MITMNWSLVYCLFHINRQSSTKVMHYWKYRRGIPWSTFCWYHKNLFFAFHHLNKEMTIHWEGRFSMMISLTNLAWNKAKSKRTVRRWLVHIVFSKWTVFVVVCTKKKKNEKQVMFWKQSDFFKGVQEATVQTNVMDKYVQDGLRLDKKSALVDIQEQHKLKLMIIDMVRRALEEHSLSC